jgi:hypothetical protein
MRTPGSVEIVAEVLSTTRNNGFVDHVCRMSDVSRPFLSDLLSLGLSSLQPGTLDAAIADEGRAWTPRAAYLLHRLYFFLRRERLALDAGAVFMTDDTAPSCELSLTWNTRRAQRVGVEARM